MATAPRPMTESRADKAAQAKARALIVKFKIDGQVWRLAIFNVPITEQLTVRRELGIPWQEVIRSLFSGEVGADLLAVVVWVARRVSGEPRLTWEEHAAQWDDDLLGDQIEIEFEGDDEDLDDEGGTDPEG